MDDRQSCAVRRCVDSTADRGQPCRAAHSLHCAARPYSALEWTRIVLQIRQAVILALLPVLASCIAVSDARECGIAAADEGWVWIEGPPDGVPEQQPSGWNRTTIWFANEQTNQVKACDRPRRAAGCFEVGRTFEKRDEEWIVLDQIDEIVCT